MTANKDLKRLVRARMRKTGESYTAARRHFRLHAAEETTMSRIPDPSTPYLFVTYATADLDLVQPQLGGLERRGINLWVDEGVPLPPLSDEEKSAIAHAVEKSVGLLAFASDEWLASFNAMDELMYARELGRPTALVQLVPEWPEQMARFVESRSTWVISGLPEIATADLANWAKSIIGLARLKELG